jgi:hypothetical protein
MNNQTTTLENMARSHFAELTDAELKLLHAAPNGELASCGPTNVDCDHPLNNPSFSEKWGKEREIRAERHSQVGRCQRIEVGERASA